MLKRYLAGIALLTMITVSAVSYTHLDVYKRQLLGGMRSGVCAVIISVVYDLTCGIAKTKDWLLFVIMAAAFIANFYFKVNVVYIILLTALVGVVRTLLSQKAKEAK